MTTGVYTITNLCNNLMYVGCTSNFETRWKKHKQDLRKRRHGNSYLQKAWNKYGEENFIFEELVTCDIEFMYSEEHYWVNMLGTHDSKYGYNIKLTHPENKNINSKEISERIRIKATGRKWSEEYKQLFREQKLGRIQSPSQIEKAAKGKYKPILQCSKSGELIKEWECAKLAGEMLNIFPNYISMCCNRKLQTYKGFIWRFKNQVA